MAMNTGTDYTTLILALAGMPVTEENIRLMRKLYGERYEKIKSDPEKYGQYENDDVMRQAKMYMDKVPVTTEKLDLDSVYKGRIDAAAENLELAKRANMLDYNYGAGQIDDGYADIRRQMELAYRGNTFADAEVLAANGLGRGYDQAPSSGYGETAMLSAYTNYANSVADTYNQQMREKNELYNNMLDNNNQAAMQYNNLLDSIYQSKGQDMYNAHQADRNYMLNAQAHNAGVSDSYIKNNLAEREFADSSNLGWANYNEDVNSNRANMALQNKKLDYDHEYNMGNLKLNKHRYGMYY